MEMNRPRLAVAASEASRAIRPARIGRPDPSQILIVIVVDEDPTVRASDLTPGAMKKIASAGMWLPILRDEDDTPWLGRIDMVFRYVERCAA